MALDKKLLHVLRLYSKKTITLSQLEENCPPDGSYQAFALEIQKLMEKEILIPIKSAGDNGKNPVLPYKYRIQVFRINEGTQQQIKTEAAGFHPAINLSVYYRQDESLWKKDLPMLQRINDYLQHYGMSFAGNSLPELSWKLTGNEKWLEEEGGRKLLERIGLWKQVESQTRPDPLMLAVNPAILSETQNNSPKMLHHLVVENKSVYYRLLPLLTSSEMAALVYGAGRKIVAGFSQLSYQLGLDKKAAIHHTIHYFGDLDWEGIAIWHDLKKRYAHLQHWNLRPATAFYQSLSQCPWSRGKINQRQQEEALTDFLAYFPPDEEKSIRRHLEAGFYCPQEALEEGLERLMKKG